MNYFTIDSTEAAKEFIEYIEENPPTNVVIDIDRLILNNNTVIDVDTPFRYVISKVLPKKKQAKKEQAKDNELFYKTVGVDYSIEEIVDYINKYEFLAFDVETTGLNTKKDKVIGFSISGKEGTAIYYPIYTYNKHNNELDKIYQNATKVEYVLKLVKTKKLYMFNGSFDIRICKSNFGIDLTDSLYSDGMLLKHTLEEEGEFSLKGIGVKIQEEIGFDVEKAANEEQIELKRNVQDNGGSTTKSNYEMYKADLHIMSKYACKDADLTIRVINYYSKKLEEQGLSKFYYNDEVMPLYKYVTIPMEEKGVKLDLDYIISSKEEIDKDIEALEATVIQELEKTSAFINWYSDKLENIKVNRGGFAQILCKHLNVNLEKTKAGKYSLTKKNVEALSGEGSQILKDFVFDNIIPRGDLALKVKEELYLEMKEHSGKKLNISSKKQLSEIVFDYMGIKPLSTTKKGNPQFNDQTISFLIEKGHRWAEYLYQYNKLIKIKGTYIERFLDGQIDGKYYFSYKQHGTISGRYGSDAQQLPRPVEEGKEYETVVKYVNRIRRFMISENNRIFLDCDYESLEPHVFANTSKDERLIDIFNKGHDFYSTIAIATEKLEGVSADKLADNYLGNIDKDKRQKAKAYCLGVPYGMLGYALGKTLGIDTKDAEALIDAYLNAYPDLKEWMGTSRAFAKKHGYVVSEAGRVRHLPRVKELYEKYGDMLLDFWFRKKLIKVLGIEEVDGLYKDYKNGLNNSLNFQIQSMAASIVNRAAIAINKEFYEKGIDGWVCAQIHDQLIMDVPEDRAEECKEIIQRCMETTTTLRLKLKAVPHASRNWQDGH